MRLVRPVAWRERSAPARPRLSATSAVIGYRLATPRIPSVPKSFRSLSLVPFSLMVWLLLVLKHARSAGYIARVHVTHSHRRRRSGPSAGARLQPATGRPRGAHGLDRRSGAGPGAAAPAGPGGPRSDAARGDRHRGLPPHQE